MLSNTTRKGGSRHSRKRGQVFLVDRNIARKEAEFAIGKRVLELGTGTGILTDELARIAESVVTVEIDTQALEIAAERLSIYKNVRLLDGDFFKMDIKGFGQFDILVSNVPYNHSSDIIEWVLSARVPAILCLQKEFVQKVLAEPGTKEYSRLSVLSRLMLSFHKIIDAPKEAFRPMPKVDSEVVEVNINNKEFDSETISILQILMEHKKKLVRNAIVDSSAALGISKSHARQIAQWIDPKGMRLFKLPAIKIYNVSKEINGKLKQGV